MYPLTSDYTIHIISKSHTYDDDRPVSCQETVDLILQPEHILIAYSNLFFLVAKLITCVYFQEF